MTLGSVERRRPLRRLVGNGSPHLALHGAFLEGSHGCLAVTILTLPSTTAPGPAPGVTPSLPGMVGEGAAVEGVLRGEAMRAWVREHDATWAPGAVYTPSLPNYAAANAVRGEAGESEYVRASCRNHSTPWDHPNAQGRPGDHGVMLPGAGHAPVACGPRTVAPRPPKKHRRVR